MANILVKRPIISEKSMRHVSEGKYVFEIGYTVNKVEVADAIKRLFKVDAVEVNTLLRAGKTKRSMKNRKGVVRTPRRKFAIVKLSKGQKIEGFDDLLKVEDAD